MNNVRKNKFIFNWILSNKLAIGTSPVENKNLIFLETKQVRNIIGLCSKKEIDWHENIYKNFNCERIVLPDSQTNLLPSQDELIEAFNKLMDALYKDITFVHCFASVERSPLLCTMYIMYKYKLSIEDALDYVKKVHPFANPTNQQLSLINKALIEIKN